MRSRLQSIFQRFGPDPFRDGKVLLSFHSDLYPGEDLDRRLLKLLFLSNGNTILLDALHWSLSDQSVAIARLWQKMQGDWGLQSAVARNVITAFWLAIGGNPDALKGLAQKTPEQPAPPKPMPSLPTKPTPTPPPASPPQLTEKPPANAVCRRSDYIIRDTTLVRYTGSDPVILIPDGICCIAEDAFVNRSFFGTWKSSSKVEEIHFPASVHTIERRAFWLCKQLRKIVFHGHRTSTISRSIKDEAFAGCESLKTVIIQSCIGSIAKNAFAGCHVTEVIAPDEWRKNHQNLIFDIMHPSYK